MFREKMNQLFKIKKESEEFPYHKNNSNKNNKFSCIEGSSIEIEYLDLIRSLIFCTKPEFVLETGPYLGYSSIAIASALKDNGYGQLYSIDIEPRFIEKAKENIKKFDDSLKINFILGNSTDVIKKLNKRFSFVLLDSGSNSSHLDVRINDLEILFNNKLLRKNFIVVIHDTSRFDKRFDKFNKKIDDLCHNLNLKSFSLDLSRGITIIKSKYKNNYIWL